MPSSAAATATGLRSGPVNFAKMVSLRSCGMAFMDWSRCCLAFSMMMEIPSDDSRAPAGRPPGTARQGHGNHLETISGDGTTTLAGRGLNAS